LGHPAYAGIPGFEVVVHPSQIMIKYEEDSLLSYQPVKKVAICHK